MCGCVQWRKDSIIEESTYQIDVFKVSEISDQILLDEELNTELPHRAQ